MNHLLNQISMVDTFNVSSSAAQTKFVDLHFSDFSDLLQNPVCFAFADRFTQGSPSPPLSTKTNKNENVKGLQQDLNTLHDTSLSFLMKGIPDICHFFYTGKIFGESNLHRKTPIFCVKSVKNATFSRKICRKCQFFALNL